VTLFWTILTPLKKRIKWQDRQAFCTRMDVFWLKEEENHVFNLKKFSS
jgi:hypothetical protein